VEVVIECFQSFCHSEYNDWLRSQKYSAVIVLYGIIIIITHHESIVLS